ncbi:MAG: FIST signal transduction protein, partial [Sagittula sp.]
MARDEIGPDLPAYVTVGRSDNADPACAAREAARAVSAHELCFVIALIPAAMDSDAVAEVFAEELESVPVFGCT